MFAVSPQQYTTFTKPPAFNTEILKNSSVYCKVHFKNLGINDRKSKLISGVVNGLFSRFPQNMSCVLFKQNLSLADAEISYEATIETF